MPELDQMAAFREEFRSEAREHLSQMEADILLLEQTPLQPDPELLHRLFRAIHSLKGGSGFLEQRKITDLSHAMETLVAGMRDEGCCRAPELPPLLLQCSDKLSLLVDHPEQEAGIDIAPELERLQAMVGHPATPVAATPDSGHRFRFELDLVQECDNKQRSLATILRDIGSLGSILAMELDTESAGSLSSPLTTELILRCTLHSSLHNRKQLESALAVTFRACTTEVADSEAEAVISPRSSVVTMSVTEPGVGRQSSTAPQKSESTIRISLDLLDRIMNLTSELVLVRNQLVQTGEKKDPIKARAYTNKLSSVTSELQASVMLTRMRPLNLLFSKFQRQVRDLCRETDKEARLEIHGGDVELDKNILEQLGDPLTHIIRNAVDHGLEPVAERQRAGKPETGRITISASHEGGQVYIEVRDDGRGMDAEHIRATAVRKGLLSSAAADQLSDQEALYLILKPGFSTAGQVTDISGRGVGMDVVNTNLRKLGGELSITAWPGQGCAFHIKLPLTLMIINALIVAVGHCCYAIPEYAIAEVVWLYGKETTERVRQANQQEVFSLRGKLIPVLRLSRVLGIESEAYQPIDSDLEEDSLYILILKLGVGRYGLIVDRIIDTEEIVIKPLHERLKECRVFAGSTVMGDGRIALIMDIIHLAQMGRIRMQQEEEAQLEPRREFHDEQAVIVFHLGKEETFAIPLFLIKHIELTPLQEIMHAEKRDFLHFQGTIIPIIHLEQVLPNIGAEYEAGVYVIILKATRPIGLLATEIIDTSLINTDFDSGSLARPGVIGAQVIGGRLTMILDVFTIIENTFPELVTTAHKTGAEKRLILLVEDDPFYAYLIRSYLSSQGARVTLARNGSEGLAALKRGQFDCIISDLEMPVMDGLEFARQVRQKLGLWHVPLFAMSAIYEEQVGTRLTREAGFDGYVSKLNKETMLDALRQYAHTDDVSLLRKALP